MKKLLLILFFLPYLLNAQFICDYSSNTQLTDTEFDHILPKIAICSNGNSFISWYEADADTYSMKLQLIDEDGNRLWSNELVVGNYFSDSWVTDYSLIVDNEDNCILAYNDYRNDDEHIQSDISVYKISQSGEFVWGNDGITFDIPEENDIFPRLLVTPQNNIIVAWMNYNYYFSLQKISASGDIQWADGGIDFQDNEPTVRYQNPFIVNADNENIFLIWTYETGDFMYPNKDIYLQKIDENGATLLDEPIVIYDNGDIPIYSNPYSVSDNTRGAYISWYSINQNVLNTYISHVDVNGDLTVPINGIPMQNNSNFSRTYSSIAVDTSGNALIFWKQSNLGQTEFGIYGQKFTKNGEKLWNEEGIEFSELSANSIYNIFAKSLNDRVLLVYEDNSIDNNTHIKISSKLIDSKGLEIWQKTVTDYNCEKADCDLSNIVNNQAVAVWYDGRGEHDNIFIQNILAYYVELGQDTTIEQNQELILDADSVFESYLWSNETTEQTLNINDYSIGDYEISVIATDVCDFEYFDTINVEITENLQIHKIESNNVKIYPNPFENYLNICFENYENNKYSVNIYDCDGGKIIQNKILNKKNNTIDLKNLVNGIYFLELVENEKNISKFKLIKQ